MIRNILAGLALPLLLFIGCIPREEYSAEMVEPAEVLAVNYIPNQYGSGMGPTFVNGRMGIAMVSFSTAESYAIVFRCQHGTFVIKNSDKAKSIFNQVRQGQRVTLHYQEVYLVDRNSKNEIVSKQFKKYHLLSVS